MCENQQCLNIADAEHKKCGAVDGQVCSGRGVSVFIASRFVKFVRVHSIPCIL